MPAISFVPGLLNAWLGMLSLTLLGVSLVYLHPRGDRLSRAVWMNAEDRGWARASAALQLALLLCSFFVPLHLSSPGFVVGLALFTGGAGLALWAYAVFLSVDEHRLIVSGPFSRTRHPIYLGSCLGMLGVCAAAHSGLLLGLTLLWLWPMHRLVLAEERDCRTRFGADYISYARQAGRYVPIRWW